MSHSTPQIGGVGCITLALAAFALLVEPVSSAKAKTITVKSGASIQAAIDSANAGDTVSVNAGTYNEQLTINTNFLTLIGNKAILKPGPVSNNKCAGLTTPKTQTGICVQGNGITLGPFSGDHSKATAVNKQVQNVTVSGFTVSGFSGANIAIVGAVNTAITANKLVDGAKFGLLSVSSDNTKATGNSVTATSLLPVGMAMDDLSSSLFTGNNVTSYATAMHIQSSEGKVQSSNIKNSCIGIYIDPAVTGAVASANVITTTDPGCAQAPNSANPAAGIYVEGASVSLIAANVISGQHRSGNAAGIAVVDDKRTPAMAVASNNRVTVNVLNDDDIKIQKDTTGTGNVYILNI